MIIAPNEVVLCVEMSFDIGISVSCQLATFQALGCISTGEGRTSFILVPIENSAFRFEVRVEAVDAVIDRLLATRTCIYLYTNCRLIIDFFISQVWKGASVG